MAENRYPLDIPPGIFHNGTRNQAEGRWYDGAGVRFYQGTKQPIGGWVQRVITGAANAGRPNAMISWLDNAENAWLAYGTSTNLFVIGSDNVRHDITPIGVNGDSPYSWSLQVFGGWLVACPSYNAYSPNGNLFVWKADPATPAVAADGDTGNIPFACFGIVTTPERFFMALRGSDPDGAAKRAPTGGAILDPAGGTVTLAAGSGTPVPVGGAIFDPAGGGLVF
jgi:hypothetical protein